MAYVVAGNSVTSYALTGAKEEEKLKLDDQGSEPRCWTVCGDDLQDQLIIARQNAINTYQPDCKGKLYVFEGAKAMVASHGSYLLVVSKDLSTAINVEEGSMNLLTIYDLQNSYIAYSAPIPPVMSIVYNWQSFNVVTQAGKVFQLREMGTKQKLDILFRKNLYDLAISFSIAKKRANNEGLLSSIYAQYGHHLCQKGEYDMAVAQFIHTIGSLEASYVIRKFLDAQRIPQLTDYLEALHRKGYANKDHTSILLNCYTKLSSFQFLDAQRIPQLTDYLEALHRKGYANKDHTSILLNCYTKLSSFQFLDAQRIPQLTDYLEALHRKGYANKDHTSILLNCYTKLSSFQFLDAQRIPQLTDYLEALHRKGYANKDHTSILLNCYTKRSSFQFLDAQRIPQLTDYLEALHRKGYANKDHTSILLNCYTKLSSFQFLDAQRIPQLTDYLEALHRKGYANKDHTSILLNCYTKLSDSEKLEQFISAGEAGEMAFDVDTAVKVLRDASYCKQALTLAKAHQRHRLYLQVELDDMKDYDGALAYIAKLPPDLAEAEVRQYGKLLLNERPEKTTELVKNLCRAGDAGDRKSKAEKFIPLFLTDDNALQSFLEYVVELDPDSASSVHNSLLELYMSKFKSESTPVECLCDFAPSQCVSLIQEKMQLKKSIMKYLARSPPEIMDHALILCHLNDFAPGMPYVFERTELTREILSHYMDLKDYAKMVETCEKYGTEQLWLETLWFFARSPECPMALISKLLSLIEAKNVLPPVLVLEILSHSSTVTFSVVKDYILRWLKKENEETYEDNAQLLQYQQDIKKNEEIIQTLENEGQVFQVFRCSACDHPLELPTVHFLCKHSFHQHCFESYADNESDCPVCAPEKKSIKATLAKFSNVEKSLAVEDGDSSVLISKYLGSYLFNKGFPQSPAVQPVSTNPFEFED